jgi:hypothetical protein
MTQTLEISDTEWFPWSERKRRGEECEQRFVTYLSNTYNLHVMQTSQHLYKPADKLTRHAPDMFIVERQAFVQIKDGLRSSQWPTVIAEIDSIEACRQFYRMNNRVWVVWEFPDGSWQGNDVQNLRIVNEISDESRRRGSGTRAYKIRKTSLKPIDELVNEHQQLEMF